MNQTTIEEHTQTIGRTLLAAARRHAVPGVWSEKLIDWALRDARFKTELFRFVDVFPVLKTPAAIHRHLVEYLQQPGVTLPPGMGLALQAGGLLKGTLAHTVTTQITRMAERFIAGRTVEQAAPALLARWKQGIGFSVDLLGEACVSHAEAADYRARYETLIHALPGLTAAWPANPVLDRDHLGAVPRVNVSVKISALDGHVSPVDAEGSIERLLKNIGPLLLAAKKHDVFINFDMEHHALRELTIRLFKRCCEVHDFDAGLALQAYLRSADEDARDLAEWARSRGRIVTVRLIKGAYWDYETLHAHLMNWPAPVWSRKSETDACFERVTEALLLQTPRNGGTGGVKLALGTHNVRSAAHAIAALESLDLPHNAIEFQALRGMADDLKLALAEGGEGGGGGGGGWRVREYVPIGEMVPGMAYLVRRLLENTSNEGWLRAGHADTASDAALLAAPAAGQAGNVAQANVAQTNVAQPPPAVIANTANASTAHFANEPLRDFSHAPTRAAFAQALHAATVPRIAIDATVPQAANAVARALAAYPAWRDTPADRRAEILERAADILHHARDPLSALVVKESHKPWAEADADVCEAIDFCRYYARQARALFTPRRLGHLAGELNESLHEPRGVAAVIAPWNFPLSICTGMTVAALVTGNAVVLKPAEQTPAIARRLCETLWRAGVPRDTLHFLAGAGETVGAALVRDARVAIIAFTGSKTVGLDILHAANPPQDSHLNTQDLIKHVICEMGGKNALIVDDSADLDEAVLAVRQSAFGYAGQKCSAGSRAIVMDAIHDAFLARLIESTRALVVGDPADPATDVGPVIDAEAAEKIRRYIDIGKREATLAYAGEIATLKPEISNLVAPHIFTHVQPQHRIAREEIFGPILAILRARDFPHALQLANDSAYKLTGGLFSRTPSHLAHARKEFRVGNLYLNRAITGALVGRQPFGGFGLSGVGAKAGGPHYLLQFTDARVITENTLRRGFAPEA